MTKYYRVLRTMPAYDSGAILKSDNGTGYKPLSSIWNRFENASDHSIAVENVESEVNSEFFLRVYPIGDPAQEVFGTKEQAQEAAEARYKGEK
jgi:hypothetical protein